MISPEITNQNTRAIIKMEIAKYIELQEKFTKAKNIMVKIRKEIAKTLEEINRLQSLPERT